jgi:hypothetical protein
MIPSLLALAPAAFAADIFLAPGDDVLTKTASLNAGDRYLFRDGVFEIPSDVTWSGAGTSDEPIILGAADGAKPIFRMTGGYYLVRIVDASFLEITGITFESADNWEEAGFNGVSMENATDITFSGNEIRNFQGYGLLVQGNSSNLTISANWFHDLYGEAIYAGCYDASCFTTDSVFSNNRIDTLGYIHEDVVTDYGGFETEYATGIVIAHGGQGNAVRDNVVYGVSSDGIYVGSTEFGPQNIVEGNAVWEAGGDGIVAEGSALIRNNVVFDIGEDGIQSYDSDRNTLQDVVISFNTVANCGEYAVQLDDWVGKSGMVLANNAIVNPIGYALDYGWSDYDGESPDPANYISTNVVTGFVDGWDAEVHPDGVIPGGGLEDFVDAAGFDFYPISTGALVNAADPSGEAYIPEVDFNGATRQGDVPDVGAYEYGGADNPGWQIGEGFKSTAPLTPAGGAGLGGCCSKSDSPEEAVILLPLVGLFGWRRRQR